MNGVEKKVKVPPFESRWLIRGTLTTESELHIGDGGVGALHDRTRPADETKKEADASTVCTTHQVRAYVPGSAIKGPLRALVVDPSGKIDPEWEELFGSDSPDDLGAVGGKLEFWDAFHARGAGISEEQPDQARLYDAPDRRRPWWNDTRKTCVAVSVSLDRRTRTAKENLLYHLEYVPKGETFDFEVSGDNLSTKEVAQLLLLLEQFGPSAARRATLGALASNGWGRVKCEVNEIRRLGRDGLAAWKKSPTAGFAGLAKIAQDLQAQIDAAKAKLILPRTSQLLVIELSLTMESPWLIRDPRQRERSKEAAEKKVLEAAKPTDAVAILDESGKPLVPSKSVRGALRARSEMILRTLRLHCDDHPAEIGPVSTKGSSTEDALEEIRGKDLSARLFGFSGWRGPLLIPRLVAVVDPGKHEQQFVAIDRFTGGAAGGAKFDAELAGRTTVTGDLAIDLGRLEEVDRNLASIGLLALVLRDLEEGDIPIGSGSAKGQGFCTATIRIDGAPDWRTHSKIVEGLTAFRALQPEEREDEK